MSKKLSCQQLINEKEFATNYNSNPKFCQSEKFELIRIGFRQYIAKCLECNAEHYKFSRLE